MLASHDAWWRAGAPTLNGLTAGQAVRVYNRVFLPDAREGPGDGSGGMVSSGSSVTLMLKDPLGLVERGGRGEREVAAGNLARAGLQLHSQRIDRQVMVGRALIRQCQRHLLTSRQLQRSRAEAELAPLHGDAGGQVRGRLVQGELTANQAVGPPHTRPPTAASASWAR